VDNQWISLNLHANPGHVTLIDIHRAAPGRSGFGDRRAAFAWSTRRYSCGELGHGLLRGHRGIAMRSKPENCTSQSIVRRILPKYCPNASFRCFRSIRASSDEAAVTGWPLSTTGIFELVSGNSIRGSNPGTEFIADANGLTVFRERETMTATVINPDPARGPRVFRSQADQRRAFMACGSTIDASSLRTAAARTDRPAPRRDPPREAC
jgi:hypothetical protein